MEIKFKKTSDEATVPTLATAGSAAYDLYTTADRYLEKGCRGIAGTGIAMAIPEGYVGLICPRSGLAANSGITVLNGPGVIDSDYRDEIKVILHNTGDDHKILKAGTRIAQMLFIKYENIDFKESKNLEATKRKGGLGSTGA